MSSAAAYPEFEADGAPLSVLIDFDGTITLLDVGDVLLSRFAVDGDEIRLMDELYLSERVGSRELMAWDMEVLPRDPDLLLREVDAIPLDETLHGLVRLVRGAGGAIEIVSDGVGFHVERMLARLGLSDLPVATNATILGMGGAGVTFPFGHTTCLVCGTCKRERVWRHQGAGRAVVLVGDGLSDRYAAHHADVVFAKGALAVWCQAQGVDHRPWHRLSDVTEWLARALDAGHIPADQASFEAWADRTRTDAPTYICGPEAWGDERVRAARAGSGPL